MPRRLSIPARALLVAALMLTLTWAAKAHPGEDELAAHIRVTARYDAALLDRFELELVCGAETVPRATRSLAPGLGRALVTVPAPGPDPCAVRASLPAGFSAKYFVEAGGAGLARSDGCNYPGLAAGGRYDCVILVDQFPGRLTVYKKWIGDSGKGEDVRIDLDCESGRYADSRYINEGEPDGWEIRSIHHEGILCNVHEEVREDYRPDIIDCQGLLILPGREEECTMVNTKIVKRIETLNRYGKIVMVLLVLAVGLAAMRRMK